MASENETPAGVERGLIVALIPDLFFSVSTRSTIRRLGFRPHIVRTVEELIDAVEVGLPALAVVDVQAVSVESDWEAIGALAENGAPILAFGPHKDVERLRRARAAGVARVVSNGIFHRGMGELIERYATTPAALVDDGDDFDEDTTGSLPPGMPQRVSDRERERPGDGR